MIVRPSHIAFAPVVLGLLLCGCTAFADGAKEGRRGTELLLSGELEAAVSQFQRGLDQTEAQTGKVRQKLWHNLGLTFFAQEQFGSAADAFAQATTLADVQQDRAASAFNAGTAYAYASKAQEALAFLRQALILDPDYEEARYNYELIKRQIPDSQAQSHGTPPEPSA
ncbi:MAG: hypothetical protein R3284_12005, partial [Rubricoccaceae bacterium]|nr:hypothetical protein [Rubricoccaceae bacterium]